MDTLRQLQNWYLAQCNEDWEHQYGVTIDTLDNPGWTLTVDLEDTELSGKDFEVYRYDREATSPGDWIHCAVKDNKFKGSGGPMKLEELIGVFLGWAAKAA